MSSLAPVHGFAQSLTSKDPIAGATISVFGCTEGLLDPHPTQVLQTDTQGRFALSWPVGADLTVLIEHPHYHPLQSLTVTVPAEGLVGSHHELALQVPTRLVYEGLLFILPVLADPDACQLVVTVAAPGKTLADDPQGEAGAIATLSPSVGPPFYVGMFERGPMKYKTNPFPRDLTQTSEDGGVFFFNIPPSAQPYTVTATATRPGVTFTTVRFYAVAGRLVNGAPPNGLTAIPSTES